MPIFPLVMFRPPPMQPHIIGFFAPTYPRVTADGALWWSEDDERTWLCIPNPTDYTPEELRALNPDFRPPVYDACRAILIPAEVERAYALDAQYRQWAADIRAIAEAHADDWPTRQAAEDAEGRRWKRRR